MADGWMSPHTVYVSTLSSISQTHYTDALTSLSLTSDETFSHRGVGALAPAGPGWRWGALGVRKILTPLSSGNRHMRPDVSTYTDERGEPVYAATQPFGHLAMIGS